VARRITLENEGDELLLRYQEGDEIPQLKADFVNGLRAFNGALALSPDSLYLQARATFCEGRVAIFDRRFVEAQRLLERSTRLDPGAAFSFNALGIAYLEQARYFEARQAFLDAIARAPFWAYPRHNLALTLTQIGAYDDAIRTYREAIALAPQYSYLPYNLGLLYQRINRRGEAQAAYLAAKAAAPWRAEPDVALGLLAAANGDAATAETFYRQALDKRPSGQTLLSARHNLALLLAADRARVSEALALWRQNGDYLASRLSLADTLARTGNREDAVREYQAALAQNSGLTAVSIRLAAELAQLRRFPEAINALRQALVARPGSIPLLEQLAELQVAAGQFAEARETYRTALPAAKDPATIKRLRNGLRRAEKAASKGGK
jgi:tetratricopeptide (TPR) repeat protein